MPIDFTNIYNKRAEGGELNTPKHWDDLSLSGKNDVMAAAVRNGITNLHDIKDKWNEFAEGGKVNKKDYATWKRDIKDYKHIDIDHDNTYDYQGFYNKYPDKAWSMLNGNPDAHFTDEFKTVYHPTFSDESIYSGKYDKRYNPQALEGGHWSEASDGRDLFRMSEDGYRGPVSMDERQQYLIDNEPDGAVLEESNGALPMYDGTLWGGVLPNVDVYNNNTYEFGGFTGSNAVTGNRGTVSRVPHDARYNHVASIYQSFVNQGVDPQVALELTNQKVTEKGWNGWVSGDKKSYGNVNDFTKHVIEHYNKMYPDSMKANGFEQFYRGIEVSPKYKYNPYPTRYRQQLLLTRPGVKKRVNEYRKTQGLGPLALQSAPTMPWDNNVLFSPVQQLMQPQPLQATVAADGGHLFKKGGSTDMANVRARQALSFFMNKGLSKAAASGLVGNLMRESNLNPNAVNPNGGAYGLAQWLGPRQKELFKLYGNHPTFDQQLDYIWRELNTTHKKGLQMLKASKTTDDAARNTFGYYEFSGGPEAAMAAMNRSGKDTKWKNPNGYSAMMKGINNARKLSGQSPLPYDAPSYSPLFRSMFSSPVRRPLSFSEAMQSPAVSYEVPKVVLPVEEESKPEPAVGMSDEDKADHFNALMSYLGMDNYLPTSSSYSKYALFGDTDNDNSMSGLMSLLGNTFGEGGQTDNVSDDNVDNSTTVTHPFTWDKTYTYNGKQYPTATITNADTGKPMQVFADNSGNVFNMDGDTALPVTFVHNLEGPTVLYSKTLHKQVPVNDNGSIDNSKLSYMDNYRLANNLLEQRGEQSVYDPNGFMDFMNIASLGLLNRGSASQDIGLAKDIGKAITGDKSWGDVVNSAVLGNEGVFDNPWANMALDVAVPAGGVGVYKLATARNASKDAVEDIAKIDNFVNPGIKYEEINGGSSLSNNAKSVQEAVEQGRQAFIDDISSPWYRDRMINEFGNEEIADRILRDMKKSAQEADINTDYNTKDLDALGETKRNPEKIEYSKDGKWAIENYDTGLSTKVANDGPHKKETTYHELLHYTTNNAGAKKLDQNTPPPDDLFDNITFVYPILKSKLKTGAKYWQNLIMRQNENLLPSRDKIYNMIWNEPDKAEQLLISSGYTPEHAKNWINQMKADSEYMWDIQEQRAHLKSWFKYKVQPNIKDPNNANEIEEYLNSHPDIIKNAPSEVKQVMEELRPGSIKDYAKYFAEALSSLPFINSIYNEQER